MLTLQTSDFLSLLYLCVYSASYIYELWPQGHKVLLHLVEVRPFCSLNLKSPEIIQESLLFHGRH